ncbi:restriction endonuclease subunit S [Lactobacillus delbrueckii subsp. lactis]|uniref:restriction endonuclease subunit S n=1 Tax=Lactobacillus delbrueckii TaxID=1584 RepID=UPI001E41F3D4|nr:restriction endonuclease subunit S [Lactobacillus delbrueckii]MCD5560707.1 restriction endonuclease subunit S [Lactobacillus delbrueckii subsp. lactis]
MKDEKKAPKLRFKGFTDDWEQCKLGDVTSSYSGGTPTASTSNYYGGAIPFIRSGEISKDSTELTITEEGLNNSAAKLVKRGDILYALYGATSGEVSISRLDGAINQAILAIKPCIGYDSYLLMSLLKNEKKKIREKFLQGGQGNLSARIVKNIKLDIPSINEQTKIGCLLLQLDRTITLHEEKKRQLECLKSALLQKMFADENGYPAVRFRGFDEAWKQCKLGDVGQTYTGLSGKSKEDFGHGKARFVTYMNIYSNPVSDLNMVEPIEIDERQNEVQYGDAFFTTSSETPEEVGMASVWTGDEKHTYLNSFCFGYRPISKINPYYLAYMLNSQSLRRKIVILAQGISRYNISKKSVMEIPASLPSAEEQNRIGLIFKDLDQSITLYEHKLELLKRLKSSLLQNMFI